VYRARPYDAQYTVIEPSEYPAHRLPCIHDSGYYRLIDWKFDFVRARGYQRQRLNYMHILNLLDSHGSIFLAESRVPVKRGRIIAHRYAESAGG
jgi:hypothetical protein